jgi:hypothetical protein
MPDVVMKIESAWTLAQVVARDAEIGAFETARANARAAIEDMTQAPYKPTEDTIRVEITTTDGGLVVIDDTNVTITAAADPGGPE